ncbi:hypothetical protein PR202_ga02063 [Eleusine coracana subsp. coracana]|uniref:NAC domain-containing protein n=1 Tax=Eleusine coracana subsp. coracana TaxID=191504 RepID=A0AAV5BKC3_ELECO|nr:hypothetical protein PR202_ga01376 [Eleusine coracana subsp. coracana]GJM86224.1 hypothetical protein PR202_ga02063 [Eleusine coracana subsp. coracana]
MGESSSLVKAAMSVLVSHGGEAGCCRLLSLESSRRSGRGLGGEREVGEERRRQRPVGHFAVMFLYAVVAWRCLVRAFALAGLGWVWNPAMSAVAYEEIITFYLKPKSIDDGFIAHAIGEADINRSEPWELPAMAKMGEKEWYFYCLKGRKYPSGFRANRATKAGYWKATGKDREIYRATSRSRRPVLVGMKKTLVFYKGRAPTGAKTDWVMHEFRLEGSGRPSSPTVGSSSSNTTAMKSSSKVG